MTDTIGPRTIDITGKRIGKVTILAFHSSGCRCSKSRKRKFSKWLCRCDCGREFVASGDMLHSKRYQGNCFRCASDNKQLNGRISYHAVASIQLYAKERGIPYAKNVTKEFLWNLFLKQNQKCTLSGVPLHFAKSKEDNQRGGSSASLDRIDNTKGYTRENVQWIHKTINHMKWDFPLNQFLQVCKSVNNKLKEGLKNG